MIDNLSLKSWIVSFSAVLPYPRTPVYSLWEDIQDMQHMPYTQQANS